MSGRLGYHLAGLAPAGLEWSRLAQVIGRANTALARDDGVPAGTLYERVLLAPLATHAALSLRVEGTNTTLGALALVTGEVE